MVIHVHFNPPRLEAWTRVLFYSLGTRLQNLNTRGRTGGEEGGWEGCQKKRGAPPSSSNINITTTNTVGNKEQITSDMNSLIPKISIEFRVMALKVIAHGDSFRRWEQHIYTKENTVYRQYSHQKWNHRKFLPRWMAGKDLSCNQLFWPQGRPGMSDVNPLPGTLGLSFDSPGLSYLLSSSST